MLKKTKAILKWKADETAKQADELRTELEDGGDYVPYKSRYRSAIVPLECVNQNLHLSLLSKCML